jgi:hypothetical protein
MSYSIQGPIYPRTDTTKNTLPYIIKTGPGGTTCDATSRELFAITPIATGSGGVTADGFSKLFLNNNFSSSVVPLQGKNIISGFMPEFYIGSPTEVMSTWTGFTNGSSPFDGQQASNYEVMAISYATQGFTATVNGVSGFVTAITGVTLTHSILQGNNGALSGTGLFRKLGSVTQH